MGPFCADSTRGGWVHYLTDFHASIQSPGNNAGSNAAAGTFVHTPCADKFAAAVGGDERFAYHDAGPREHLPKGQPRGAAHNVLLGRIIEIQKHTVVPIYTSGYEPDSEGNSLRRAQSRRHEPDREENGLKRRCQGNDKTPSPRHSTNAHQWRCFSARYQPGARRNLKSVWQKTWQNCSGWPRHDGHEPHTWKRDRQRKLPVLGAVSLGLRLDLEPVGPLEAGLVNDC